MLKTQKMKILCHLPWPFWNLQQKYVDEIGNSLFLSKNILFWSMWKHNHSPHLNDHSPHVAMWRVGWTRRLWSNYNTWSCLVVIGFLRETEVHDFLEENMTDADRQWNQVDLEVILDGDPTHRSFLTVTNKQFSRFKSTAKWILSNRIFKTMTHHKCLGGHP